MLSFLSALATSPGALARLADTGGDPPNVLLIVAFSLLALGLIGIIVAQFMKRRHRKRTALPGPATDPDEPPTAD
ncbi:hypothetical protein [Leucobacter sp. M11]|uniref:hypothetical protein n=1 Tax=Leucobacter sp. M11 TaxID=2993565 RepID=UPI002D7E89FD|nr:hypothetical protein [Leucobacter sp. M11]MEB4615024.1 hypothetical protein [Leucobacter sp. M11]